jgi:hypothetical protein
MIRIAHRRNTRQELIDTPTNLGIEVDIRSFGSELVVHHEPFVRGESFEHWLEAFQHQTLILNTKEEGLEERLILLMAKHGMEDFFFLDQSFPFLVRTARTGESRCAVRVSEYESIDTALSLKGLIDWVWVDCFSRFPLNGEQARQLQDAGLKLCLVSPELQGRDLAEIGEMRAQLAEHEIQAEAVCTKKPELWASGES